MTLENSLIEQMLDRPIWTALSDRHAHLAAGKGDVLRYRPGILPLIGFATDDAERLERSATLFEEGEQLVTLQRSEPSIPAQLRLVSQAPAVQLVAGSPTARFSDDRIVELGESDLDQILALAELTRPGPFTRGSLLLGTFYGIKIEGRLAAMAGHRWHQPGFAEVSGVCTHPDFSGRGFARALSRHVASLIWERGERPYLHAYASNTRAIELYRSIGFELRAEMHVAFYARTA